MQQSLQVVVAGQTQNMFGTSASAPVFAAMGERQSGVGLIFVCIFGPFCHNTGLYIELFTELYTALITELG